MAYETNHRPVAVVAIADDSARQLAVELLEGLNWQTSPAASGAQALSELARETCTAMLLDSWLPDLEMSEFMFQCRRRYPGLDLVMLDDLSTGTQVGAKHPRRQELLYVLRQALSDHASPLIPLNVPAANAAAAGICDAACRSAGPLRSDRSSTSRDFISTMLHKTVLPESSALPQPGAVAFQAPAAEPVAAEGNAPGQTPLPEFVGSSARMREFTRMIRLVAPRRTPVLIEGATGTGKELTARAIHRLSPRSRKPMIVLNCAAIPESLLEAEVFGHTRGAFTGAVTSRIGRIEAADGGTLFLDEIGEMPLQLQSKLLRFLECGELQRVGENNPVTVDVRVIAATNQPLSRRVMEGHFRGDLYYRLAVFPIATPTLKDHAEDIPQLAQHFLRKHAQTGPAKEFDSDALPKLLSHAWPGNVRELEHCIERAYILADELPRIAARDIQFGVQSAAF